MKHLPWTTWRRAARPLRAKLDGWVERPHRMFKELPVRGLSLHALDIHSDLFIGLVGEANIILRETAARRAWSVQWRGYRT